MKRFKPPAILLAVALLSASYLGSYVAMLHPEVSFSCVGTFSYSRRPGYRIDSALMQAVYSPLAWLDRKIRPQYWFWEQRWNSPFADQFPTPPAESP